MVRWGYLAFVAPRRAAALRGRVCGRPAWSSALVGLRCWAAFRNISDTAGSLDQRTLASLSSQLLLPPGPLPQSTRLRAACCVAPSAASPTHPTTHLLALLPPHAEVQKRSTPVLLDRDDCIIQSQTGSGKTLAFVLPLLSRLAYPPDLYPDDLKVSQNGIIIRSLTWRLDWLLWHCPGGASGAPRLRGGCS